MGLHRAWPNAKIVGFDIEPQPRYPFQFFQFDVMEMLFKRSFIAIPLLGEWEFDFIWASVVCKGYSRLRSYGINRRTERREKWPDQIADIRGKLIATCKPYCIENVPSAPLETDMFLCGQMFGLPLIRHRLFETNFGWLRPPHVCAKRGATRRGEVFTICGNGGGKNAKSVTNRAMHWTKKNAQDAMGIDWMTRKEMSQAIPPVYSEFIAKQFAPIS